MNVNSIYGREKQICDAMYKHNIALLAIQEPMLRLGRPPTGLFKTTLAKPGPNGRRGLMWVIRPDYSPLASAMTSTTMDPDPNLFWLKVNLANDQEWNIVCVYLPNEKRDAKATVSNLLRDIRSLPEDSFIVILGDMNADPFTKRGVNVAALRLLTSAPQLELLVRPSPDKCTRPKTQRHIDNVVASRPALDKLAGALEYVALDTEHQIRTLPSDHLMLIASFAAHPATPRHLHYRTQFNTYALLNNTCNAYTSKLRELSLHWIKWARCTRHTMHSNRIDTSDQILGIAHEAIKFIVYSASYQTLGTRRAPIKNVLRGTLNTTTLSGMSRDAVWEVVKQCRANKTTPRIPWQALEKEMEHQAKKTPNCKCRKTRRWVNSMCNSINETPANLAPNDAVIDTLIPTYVKLLEVLVAKLNNEVSPGPDGIQALHLKRAPKEFLVVIASFAAWCAEACIFPPRFQLARAKFIPRHDGRFRGLRLQDLITKLVEQLIVDPIFPAVGPKSELIAPEHMANKQGISAEHVSVVLAQIIESHKGEQLFILIADVKSAYDNTWREGLWAMCANAHSSVLDVKRIRALYESYAAQIMEPEFRSKVIRDIIGLPQGGPRSGDLFCFFTSELPDEIKTAGAGCDLFGVFLICLIFLDDFLIPVVGVEGEQIIIRVLDVLACFADRWSLTWAIPKLKVLCFNVPNPPTHWPLGREWVESASSAKYLSVHFNTKRTWNTHFTKKLTAAKLAAADIRDAGLLGGKNVPNDSLEIIRAVVWATLDYGRAATLPRTRAHETTAAQLSRFQIEVLREALELSSSAPIDGVLGETGEVPDEWREIGRQLSVAHQMLSAPTNSLPRRIAEAAYSLCRDGRSPGGGLFATVHQFLIRQVGDNADIRRFSREGLKSLVRNEAQKEWRMRVANSRRLNSTYSNAHALAPRGYLGADFRGRQVLLKLRVDDLALGAGRWANLKPQLTKCALCGRAPETRQHFVLSCAALNAVRATHSGAMALCARKTPSMAYQTLILAQPPRATEDISRARMVGALLYELWKKRCELLGIRLDLW